MRIAQLHRHATQLLAGGLFAASMLTAVVAAAGTAVQPGVFYFEPDGIDLQLENLRSGTLCLSSEDAEAVCDADVKVLVAGEDSCELTDGSRAPCTRFGYAFDYRGASPGNTIDCTAERRDPMGRGQSFQYRLPLPETSGRIFFPTFRPFRSVDSRLIFSEVHKCSYQGEMLVNMEYMLYYEPGTVVAQAGAGQTADPQFPEVPLACASPYLTEAKARGLLNVTEVKPSAANEHIPELQSQCIYSGASGQVGQVGYVYKFMLADMFDVDKLEPMQVEFNATFASGGAQLTETRNELGDRAFVFRKGDRTSLLVITGIRGSKGPTGRDREFIADYHLDHPELAHARRTDMLIELAEEDLETWSRQGP